MARRSKLEEMREQFQRKMLEERQAAESDKQDARKTLDEERRRFGFGGKPSNASLGKPPSKAVLLERTHDVAQLPGNLPEKRSNFSKASVIPPIQPRGSEQEDEDDPRSRAVKSVPNVRYRAPAVAHTEHPPAAPKPHSASATAPRRGVARESSTLTGRDAGPENMRSPDQIVTDMASAPPPQLSHIRARAEALRKRSAGSAASHGSGQAAAEPAKQAPAQPHPPRQPHPPARKAAAAAAAAPPASAYDEFEQRQRAIEEETQREADARAEQEKRAKAEIARKKKAEAEERKKRDEERKAQMKQRQQQRQDRKRGGDADEGANEEDQPAVPFRSDSPPLPAAKRASSPPLPAAKRAASPPLPAASRAAVPPQEMEGQDDDGEDEQFEIDDQPDANGLLQCTICGRRFAEDRLDKHKSICEKNKAKKRKAFDLRKQRMVNAEQAAFVANADRTDKVYEKKAKKSNWRAQHENFIAAIRAAKDPSAPPAPPAHNPDFVTCNGCGRRFNEDAAARHMPKCLERTKTKRK